MARVDQRHPKKCAVPKCFGPHSGPRQTNTYDTAGRFHEDAPVRTSANRSTTKVVEVNQQQSNTAVTTQSTTGAAFFRLADDTIGWEPFFVGDRQIGEINLIRETLSNSDASLTVALWRSEPQTFPYFFETDETLFLIEGRLDIGYPDGTTVTLHAGDSISFAKGHDTIWTVHTPSKKLFISG